MNFNKEFIQLLVQQDELAFTRFYEQSVDDFFRYVMGHYVISKEEASDIVSEVYLKIWENLEKYDEKYEFWQYVRWILKNHCKDYCKKRKPVLFSHLGEDYDANLVDHSSQVMDEDMKWGEDELLFHFSVDNAILMDTLNILDRDDQEFIYSKFVLGYNYETMSDVFALQPDALRQKLSRILKKLKQQLAHTRD